MSKNNIFYKMSSHLSYEHDESQAHDQADDKDEFQLTMRTDSNKEQETKIGEDNTKKHEKYMDDEEDDDNPECGWGPWKPRWAQYFNNPKGYLFLLCFQGFMQGMIAFGFLYVVITTLEKRFNLSSLSSGTMVSCYDIAGITVVIFVTYLGERGNKPAWVGWGGLIFATGATVFSLPHFITGFYDFEVTEFDVCDANRTISEECDPSIDNSSLSKFLFVFMVGNLLMGLGASPLYTLGVTYLDENLMPEDFGFYMGIFNAAAGLGPGLGYLLGGLFLNIYTDVRVDNKDLTISPDSPIWVGAWWMGFVIGGGIMFLSSIPFIGFPSKPPGAKRIAKLRKSQAQMGTEFEARQGIINSVKDFPIALWKLFKNITFMMLTGAAITEWFILTGLAVFAPKYLESQFNMTVSQAALYTGILTLISGIVGSLFGGWVMKRFKLNCLGQIKFCMILVSISFGLVFGFFIFCDDIPFAGVTVRYDDSSVPIGRDEVSNITAACNADCNCEAAFDPVCGINNVMYYTACHAGCHVEVESEGKSVYNNCTCVMESGIPISNATIQAKGGRCGQRCEWQWVFLLLALALLTVMFAATIPAWTATVRCVSHSQRALGLGVQTVLYGLLGTIPGPIVYGLFIDKSCLIWEYTCDGYGTCWLYDNKLFAHSFLLVTVTMKILSLCFFIACIAFYKPVKGDEEDIVDSEEKLAIDDNITYDM